MILSNRTQASIIAALVNGKPCEVDPDQLSDEWREMAAAIADIPVADRWARLLHQFGARGEADYARIQILDELRQTAIAYPPIDDTLDSLPDLEWLWHGWIPRGQITILLGDPAAGKSYLSLDLCRRVAAGDTWPDGAPIERAGNVLYVDAENRPSVLKARVGPWLPNERQRLFYMLPADDHFMVNLDYDLDRERLLDRVYRIRPDLVVIDSYSSISLHGENNKEDVQQLLSFLTRVGRDYDCAILVIHHQRKPSRLQLSLPGLPELSIHNIRGSGHIGAMATNVLGLNLIGANRNGARSLHAVKNNVGRYPDPIGVTFTPWDENPEVAILSYGEVPESESTGVPLVERCADWLIELLEEMGPLPPDEIIAIGDEEGYNRRMIYRARKRLDGRIADTSGARKPDNRWTVDDGATETDHSDD